MTLTPSTQKPRVRWSRLTIGSRCPSTTAFPIWRKRRLSTVQLRSALSRLASTTGQRDARGFFWFYFVNEHFLRFLKKRFPADYDTIRLDLFWGLMLVWLMPWTAFIVQAIGRVPYRIKQWRAGLTPEQRGTLLFVLWMLSVLVFFSFSSRQEYYVIPGVPGLALMLGGWLARETTSPLESRERRTGRISSLVLVVIGVAACVAAVTLAVQSHTPPVNYDIAELLKKNPQDYALSFGHFLDLTPQAMGAFRVPLL